ncbi:Rne/Rng family ribonuclease [Arcanobacterium hippocoleae]|uniref:Ribonuclease E n=2 Tax=Arcanobacterium hippocoleae TaxID=149017 RepID=A0ABU1T4G2_9ACTO|nr:Rne/Rng family ribonuclease [Arcanobacterium hippocoleae]MDR6940136.1 ribonuclease E [Arcanobacterium hippocoleae]
MADENPSVDVVLEVTNEDKPVKRTRRKKSAPEQTPENEFQKPPAKRTRRTKRQTSAPVETAAANTPAQDLPVGTTDAHPVTAEKKPAVKANPRKRRVQKSEMRDKSEVSASVAQSLAELTAQEPMDLFSAKETAASSGANVEAKMAPMTALLFQAPDVTRAVRARATKVQLESAAKDAETATAAQPKDQQKSEPGSESPKRSRRGSRGGKRGEVNEQAEARISPADAVLDEVQEEDLQNSETESSKRTRKRARVKVQPEARAHGSETLDNEKSDPENTTVRRRRRRGEGAAVDAVTAPKGSTRLEAKRQRRKEGREAGRRRHSISESEFLARRESVNREMLVRERDGLNQIAVLEDGILVEHYVARHTQISMVGNVYLGRVQNVLPSMEAAFVDIGKGRNAVLYSGEVNWDAAGMEGKPRKIEDALKSGDTVLVQVTKDPIGHKGARLTGQITLAGRHLVLVPNGTMTGISRKLPESERMRLKKILKQVVPSEHGVIVRTAAEGASEEQLVGDVQRLIKSWKDIDAKSKSTKNAPSLLKGEPELAVRVVRDVFNEDFNVLKVQGENSWETISSYVHDLSPELEDRVAKWEHDSDIFAQNRVDEQLQKAFDRKVFLPSGGSLVIDRTEAMTVIDVNTGKFTGASGGTLEETVTKNNLEAAEEIVRQLRLRDIGGIVVIDFIDMVLEANRDLVLRRLIECLGRDRTRHQVAEVTSLGLVQMTRKRVGQGLVEAFSTTCEACEGRGYISHDHPVEKDEVDEDSDPRQYQRRRNEKVKPQLVDQEAEEKHAEVKAALANIAAAAALKHEETLNSADTAQAEEKSEIQENRNAVKENRMNRVKRRKTAQEQRGAAEVARSENLQAAMETEAKAGSKDEPETQAAEKAKMKTGSKRRRVSSTGTITPASSASFAIMSFPAVKKDEQ